MPASGGTMQPEDKKGNGQPDKPRRRKKMLKVEKRHIFGGGTMETKYVIYDTEKRKTVSKEFPNKKTADKALARLQNKK